MAVRNARVVAVRSIMKGSSCAIPFDEGAVCHTGVIKHKVGPHHPDQVQRALWFFGKKMSLKLET